MFLKFINRSADLLIGGLDRNPGVQNVVGGTITYYQEDQTWCVKRAKLRSLWENIFSMFTLDMWLLIALVTQVIAFAICLIMCLHNQNKRMNAYSTGFLTGIATSLNLPAPKIAPLRASLRTLLISCLVYGIVLSNTFNSYLISVLSKPRTKFQVNSIEDAIENGFNFAGGNVIYDHYEQVQQKTLQLVFKKLKNIFLFFQYL